MTKIQLLGVVLLLSLHWQVCGDKTIQPCGPKLCEELCQRYNCSTKTFDAIQLSCQLTLKAPTNRRCPVTHETGTRDVRESGRQSKKKTNDLHSSQQDEYCPWVHMKSFLHACRRKDFPKIKRLLDQGLVPVNCIGYRGRRPVMYTAFYNWPKAFDLLVQLHCDLMARSKYNRTVLHIASEKGAYVIVKKLVDNLCYDFELKDNWGHDALSNAVYHGRVRVVKFLMDRGADIHVVDSTNNTMLHIACMVGHVNMIRYILSLNITDIESKGEDGNSPLMFAAKSGNISAVNLLLKHNSSLLTLNNLEENVLHMACVSNKLSMVKFLLSQPEAKRLKRKVEINELTPDQADQMLHASCKK